MRDVNHANCSCILDAWRMIGCGYLAHMLRVVVMDVTFVFQKINHRFVGVVKIPAMRPASAAVDLDRYLSQTLDGFSPGHSERDFPDPIRVNSRFIKVSASTTLSSAKELIS